VGQSWSESNAKLGFLVPEVLCIHIGTTTAIQNFRGAYFTVQKGHCKVHDGEIVGGFDMRADMVPGAIFPDYELSDHTGKHRKLSELQGQHPMVLVLSRGGFCPKDRRQAEGLVELHRELEVAYCRLVTVSTDNITETNEYRSGVGAHWPFLSDVRRVVQKDLDIAEYTDPLHNPMIPHVIVLEPGLVIYKIYNGYWFFGRPTVEDLRQDLRAVTRKCRPDWDITTPELKAAWQQGRKERFYPYGKTYVQTLGEQD
jgi:peroxiredoxin